MIDKLFRIASMQGWSMSIAVVFMPLVKYSRLLVWAMSCPALPEQINLSCIRASGEAQQAFGWLLNLQAKQGMFLEAGGCCLAVCCYLAA